MSKTLVFENGGSGCQGGIGELGTLAALGANGGMGGANAMWPMMAMMGGGAMGGFGGGMWNNPIWAIVFLAALRNGGLFGDNNNNGCGNGQGAQNIEIQSQLSAIRETLGTNQNTSLLMDAIKGNAGAVHELASNLNCDFNAVQTAINAVQSAICSVGSKVDMNSMQVVNAINAGNASLATQLQSCCCDIRTSLERQGYENRLTTIQQTDDLKSDSATKFNIIGAKIDAQTQLLSDKFCELEKREMQREINSLRDERSQYQMSALLQQQSQNIINTVRPCPIPAFVTCNPWSGNGGFYGNGYPYGGYPYGGYGDGCGNGCGC